MLLNGFVAMELARIDFLNRDFLGRSHRALSRLDLSVRGQGAEAALAATDDAV